MEVGQLILVNNIEKIGGKPQVSSIRPAIVRQVYAENLIDVRLVSTIYVSDKVKAATLEEAENAIKANLMGVLPHEEQYIIITPEDGTLNFSYVFGNMYTDILNTDEASIVILKDKKTKKPIIIREDTLTKIEEKEIEGIIKDIIKQYSIEFKKINK